VWCPRALRPSAEGTTAGLSVSQSVIRKGDDQFVCPSTDPNIIASFGHDRAQARRFASTAEAWLFLRDYLPVRGDQVLEEIGPGESRPA
jgi:hypothetical protein